MESPVLPPDPEFYVSTGSLPDPERVQDLVDTAHQRYLPIVDGEVSRVYPALAEASPELFGLTVIVPSGRSFEAGDATHPFSLMSVVKPFAFALLCEEIGADEARRRIGSNATGLAFNSLWAIERAEGGRTNPMVNPGAIATVGMLPGGSLEDRWDRLLGRMSEFAGTALELDDALHASAAASNHRNRAVAGLLHSLGALPGDPDEAIELYTRVCCLTVTTGDIARMGSVLADAGVDPVSGQRVVSLATCRAVLAVMTTAGLYETSGDWLYEIGLPGKSGIGGGIVTISPGKGALGTFSPPLDAAGNSVRGRLATRFLSRSLGLDLFASAPPSADGP